MSTASQEMEGVPSREWPFGYFFLLEKTCMGKQRLPALKGEMMLRNEKEQAAINFQIRELRPDRRTYSLFLFRDEHLLEPISFSEINYPDDNGMHLSHRTQRADSEARGYVCDVVIRAMHVPIYDHIIAMMDPLSERKEGRREAFWYVPFEKDDVEDFEERSTRNFTEIITDIRILLRH